MVKYMAKNHSCNPYEGGEIPPCSVFLGDTNPIIKDGRIIYINDNRLFFFISTISRSATQEVVVTLPETTNPLLDEPFTSTNFQISITSYIIGLFINKIQKGQINYDKNCDIHSDKTINTFIHNMLQNTPEFDVNFIPSLSLIISHSGSILPLYTNTFNITPLNYLILYLLTNFENSPGLYFGNNDYVFPDPINFSLAALNIQFPVK